MTNYSTLSNDSGSIFADLMADPNESFLFGANDLASDSPEVSDDEVYAIFGGGENYVF